VKKEHCNDECDDESNGIPVKSNTNKLVVRKREGTIYLSNNLLNNKTSMLTALVTLHTSYMQSAANGTLSKDQFERMEKNEQQIERLRDEIDELDRNIRSHYSAPVLKGNVTHFHVSYFPHS
jgi:hypothetical protein